MLGKCFTTKLQEEANHVFSVCPWPPRYKQWRGGGATAATQEVAGQRNQQQMSSSLSHREGSEHKPYPTKDHEHLWLFCWYRNVSKLTAEDKAGNVEWIPNPTADSSSCRFPQEHEWALWDCWE